MSERSWELQIVEHMRQSANGEARSLDNMKRPHICNNVDLPVY